MTNKEAATSLDFHKTKIYTEDKKAAHSRDFGAGWEARTADLICLLKQFTCHTCKQQDTCTWAWDMYNTNGDCLADK